MADDKAWLHRFLSALPAATPAGTPTPGLSAVAPVTVAPVLARTPMPGLILTPALLGRLGARDPDLWAPLLGQSCARHAITTPRRMAAFLANVLVESGRFGSLVESLNYAPDSLLRQWPSRFTPAIAQALGRTAAHPADQRGIAEAAYGGRYGNGPPGSGDGWLYRGRGLIQLTFKANYERFAKSIQVPLATLPGLLETRAGAAESAAAFWEQAGCNPVADRGDITQVRALVNGGSIGLDEVRKAYQAACKALDVSPSGT